MVPQPGLRGRVAASLVLTAAVALGVAALALLAPLEHKLRTQEVRDLATAAVQSRASFSELDETNPSRLRARLRTRVRRVASETGARVALIDSAHNVLVNTDPDSGDRFKDVAAALKTDRPVRRIVTQGSTPEARVAVRVNADGRHYVLALRKPLTEQHVAVVQVQRAFATAALVALAVALIVAGIFAATVGRRLRALRDAVLRFRIGGGGADDLPDDRSADEVGDLSRAFADLATRLDHEEKVRRDFVATASHELRTPLMTLQGRLELLADELGSPAPDLDDGRRQLADARDQADRLGRLAADLLDLSRLDDSVELRSELVDLPEIVRAVASEFTNRFASQHRELEIDAQRSTALADPTACARILRVLIDNGLRYSDTSLAITVPESDGTGLASLSVSDGGPGIPEEERELIFQRFSRGTSADSNRGFGLGLAIARELAERMGGSLTLAGNERSGTTFVLRLPRPPDGS